MNKAMGLGRRDRYLLARRARFMARRVDRVAAHLALKEWEGTRRADIEVLRVLDRDLARESPRLCVAFTTGKAVRVRQWAVSRATAVVAVMVTVVGLVGAATSAWFAPLIPIGLVPWVARFAERHRNQARFGRLRVGGWENEGRERSRKRAPAGDLIIVVIAVAAFFVGGAQLLHGQIVSGLALVAFGSLVIGPARARARAQADRDDVA